jgi:RecA/RadA recombinase
MTPVKKAEPKAKVEKKDAKKEVAKDIRDLTPKERRERFLKMRKNDDEEKDWRIVKADVEEEKIPFGLLALDNVLQLGGLPRRGRVLQFHGQEHGGKSTLCCKIIGNYQAQTGEPAVIYDFEGTLSWDYLKKIGVDPDLAILYTPDSIQTACIKAMEQMENGTRVFMFDSIPAMKPMVDAKEIKSGKAFKPSMGRHARAMQEFFDLMLPHARRYDCTFLMVNQERARMDGTREAEYAAKYPSFTNLPYTLPGGRAARYYMSAMVEVNVKKAWKYGKAYQKSGAAGPDEFVLGPQLPEAQQGDFIATEIAARVLKNKMSGGGYRGGTIWIRPGQGVDDYISIRQMAREYELIFSAGKKWIVGDHENPIITYNTKAEALEDLVINCNTEILDRLKPLVAAAIDRDKTTRFAAEGVDDNTVAYLEGEKDFEGDEEGEEKVAVKNIAVDEL